MNDGLKDKYRQAIIGILSANPRVTRAVLFGSRAMGTFTTTSDVDIALFGDELTLSDPARLIEAIDELPVPQQVDLLLHKSIRNKNLLRHIEKHGVEWYGRSLAMAGGWQMVPVANVAIPVLGGTPKRSVPEYWGGQVKWASARDIASAGSRHLYQTQETITEKGVKNSAAKILPKGTTVITARGTVGALVQLGCDMAFNQTCYGLTTRKGVSEDYLFYALNGSLQRMHNLSYGTVFDTITKKTFNQWIIPLPPLPEQRAIARILGSLDDRIELNRRMNRTLEAVARAIFKSWFVDFLPVRAKAEGRPTGLPDDIAALFPDSLEDSELGEIPRGWKVKPLVEVINFKEGPGIRNWQYTNTDEGTRFINIRCIKNRDLDLQTANRITDEEAFGKYAHFQLEKDDLVVSTPGTLGRFAIVRSEHLPLVLNTSVIRMRPISPNCTLPYLIGYVETSLQWELETRASGSVQRNFGPMHLKQISMLVPAPAVLEAHNDIAEKWLRLSLHLRSESSTLASLRDTLLPKLISGDLRLPAAALEELAAQADVSDAEKIVKGTNI